MKFPGFPGKPGWLSKDASARLAAVLHDNAPELLASLGRLAREDADTEVRIAALKRLADPGIAQGLAHDDADPKVRAQARTLWLDLLSGTHASAPSLPERVRLLKAQDEVELIEHIARRAHEPELRRAALARAARPAFLAERALDDADADIRASAVDRIDDEAQLARLAERARKSDKQVNRRARDRIETLRLARGDGATLEQRARSLCEQLEQLVRDPGHSGAETAIAARWRELDTTAPAALQTRFRVAGELLAASRSAQPRATVAVAAMETQSSQPVVVVMETAAAQASEDTTTTADAGTSIEAVVVPLLAQARFAASIDEVNTERQLQRERQQAMLADLRDMLTALDAAIESGSSAQAHTLWTRANARRREIGELPRTLMSQLAASEQRYAEMSRWRHWADNQRRVQLCEEIEALPEAALHPDALAARIRDAQNEWTRLDAIEGNVNARPGGLPRRFHAACRAALAPAKAYFRKRQELRQTHAQQVAILLGRVGEPAPEPADWAATTTLRREVADALRGLDGVEPRERKALAQNLKAALTTLDARIEQRDRQIEQSKAALIAEAESLGQAAPQRGAVATVRELQQRWQALGNGRRSRDQAQWKAFRGAIDAVFGKLDAERAERGTRDTEARAQAESLCGEIEVLADSAQPPEGGAQGRLQAAWDALHVRDEGLSRRFAQARERLREASTARERKHRHARFTTWRERDRLCRSAELGAAAPDSLREQWNALSSDGVAATELAQRFDAALAGAAMPATAEAETVRDILIQLEFLAGLESPAVDRERRRALQVARLAARMRGDAAAMKPADELAALLTRWSALGVIDDDDLDLRLQRGLDAALDVLS
jgi:hypothetical protein